MIFGLGKQREVEAEERDFDLVLFRGTLSGKRPNLKAAGRLVEVGLVAAKELVSDALIRRADLIRIEPKGAQSQVMLSIDGVGYSGGKLSKQEASAITQMLKLLGGMNIKVRTKPQAGGLKVDFEDESFELHMTVTPVAVGERLVIRAKNLSIPLETPVDLGFTDELRAKIRELPNSKGFLGIVGPPNSGTTTTTFAVLRGLDAFLYQIYTFGDMQGREFHNLTPFEPLEGDDFETTLTRCFRKEANVIFCDPIKNAETAKTILDFTDEGTLIAEFTSKDAASGVAQLIQWTQDPEMVAESVSGIISQKLIRTLCDDCKEAFRPNAKFLKKAGLPTDIKSMFRRGETPEGGEPCEKCDGIGFYGRVGMFEHLEFTEPMRELVAKGPQPRDIRSLARKEGMPTLQNDGLRLVAEGKTSLDELQRAFRARK